MNKPYTLYLGDMLEVLDTLPENSVDAIVTDPPYEISFMSKGWDNTGIAFNVETWKKCLRVLKHGGHLLAFNHSRTFHRMWVAIEDAGFEIRDTIMWVYGSGFPKSLNIAKAIESKITTGSSNTQEFKKLKGDRIDTKIGYTKAQFNHNARPNDYTNNSKTVVNVQYSTEQAKQWDGWGTALKPSHEPICLARKPIAESSIAQNVLKWGVGGINIDECRVGSENINVHNAPKGTFAGGEQGRGSDTESYINHIGRFPANLIHDGSEEVVDLFPSDFDETGIKGSASRFFYTSKASQVDRDEGLEEFEEKETRGGGGRVMQGYNDNDEEQQRLKVAAGKYGAVKTTKRNIHPTVKPTDLMQYLVRLITPKGGTVLDPFMGSGSTGKACMLENLMRDSDYKFIGVDMTPEYIEIAQARIEKGLHYDKQVLLTQDEEGTVIKEEQPSIFDFIDKEE